VGRWGFHGARLGVRDPLGLALLALVTVALLALAGLTGLSLAFLALLSSGPALANSGLSSARCSAQS